MVEFFTDVLIASAAFSVFCFVMYRHTIPDRKRCYNNEEEKINLKKTKLIFFILLQTVDF